MPKGKSQKVISKKMVEAALWVFLFSFALLGLLGPGTRLWVFDFIPSFLFGLLGYWLFWPSIILSAVYVLFFRRFAKKLPILRLSLSIILLLLGLSALLSHIGTTYEETFSDMSLYLDPFFESFGNSFGATLPFQMALGGGFFGYVLACLFGLSGLPALVYLFSIVLIIGGLVVFFYPNILALIRFIHLKITLHRGEKQRKKQEKQEQEKQEIPEEDIPSLSYQQEAPIHNAPILGIDDDYDVSGKRRDLKEAVEAPKEAPASPSPIPTPIEHSYYQDPNYVPQSMYGLQEAVFSLSGAPVGEANNQPPSFSLNEANLELASLDPFPGQRQAPIVEETNPIPPKEEEKEAPIEEEKPFFEEPSYLKQTQEEPIPPLPKEENIEKTPEEQPLPADFSSLPQEDLFIKNPLPEEKPAPIMEEPIIQEPIPQPAPEPIPQQEAPKEEEPEPAPAPAPRSVEDDWVSFGEVKQKKAKNRKPYTFPSYDKLKSYAEDKNAIQNQKDGEERSLKIDQAFKDLHVGAHVESYTIGPSVTRYNIQTDPSVSVTAVKKVVDDVMVRLGGVLGLFQEVVPGSATSGLEIPNRVQSIVPFKETIESMPQGEKANLFIPFGKSIEGKVVSADLSDFPHMLVSGSTGSGKSIFMHGMIMSLIMRNRPEDLKLVLVDPKRVEMGKYRDIPHLLCPIIKEPSHAKVCMEKLCDEMERRYTLFEYSGVSNIRQFNKDIAPEKGCEKLPFIIVIIDEYADLVDTCKDIGDPIVRLAQKARAAGIHLVIATQRPDTNVINGRIKANIAVRVALSLSSAIDSMTVLGEGGAEKLSGHGDMLVKCDQVSRIGFSRLQGCFVDNSEIRDAVESIKEQQKVIYDPNFLDLEDHAGEVPEANIAAPTAAQLRAASNQDKYLLIREAIMSREYTSISQIQREFSVGFPRAGKIFAQLQEEGIVAKASDSPSSSKGCRVLIHNINEVSHPGSVSQSSTVQLPPPEEE